MQGLCRVFAGGGAVVEACPGGWGSLRRLQKPCQTALGILPRLNVSQARWRILQEARVPRIIQGGTSSKRPRRLIDSPWSSEVGGDIAAERRAPHRDIGFGFGSCSCRACGRSEAAWACERPPLARPRRRRLTPSFGWHEVVRDVSLWCLVVSRGAPRCLVVSRGVSCGVSCGVSRVVSRGVSCVGSCGVSWCLVWCFVWCLVGSLVVSRVVPCGVVSMRLDRP